MVTLTVVIVTVVSYLAFLVVYEFVSVHHNIAVADITACLERGFLVLFNGEVGRCLVHRLVPEYNSF